MKQMCHTSFGINSVCADTQCWEAAMQWDYNIPVQCQELLQWETWPNGSGMPSTQQAASAKRRLYTARKLRILRIFPEKAVLSDKEKGMDLEKKINCWDSSQPVSLKILWTFIAITFWSFLYQS